MKKKKLVIVCISLAILLGLGLWVKSRYNVWFGNPPEPEYVPHNQPHRILVTFGNEEGLSRNISWQCDSVVYPSYALVVDTLKKDTVRIEAEGEVFQSRSGKTAFYHAKLRHLQPDSYYKYQVCTNGIVSDWEYLTTYNGKTANDCSFLYIGDVQDTINGRTNIYLQRALKAHPESEFIVCGGDLTERPIDAYWEETFKGIDGICQHIPLLNVTGNHDYLKHVIRKLERRFSLIFSYFLDSMVGENQVYTLKYNDMQFFVLDSNREVFYLFTQQEWLEEQLEKSTAKWKIVVLHHPLYSIKRENNNLMQRTLFGDLIEEGKVDLVLQGHEHAYGRLTLKTEDGKMTTPIYTISHCSPKNYKINNAEAFDKVLRDTKMYQIIRVQQDTLQMSAYKAEDGELFDRVSIVKNDEGTKVFE